MKKIISILLIAIMLTSVFSIFALAKDEEITTVDVTEEIFGKPLVDEAYMPKTSNSINVPNKFHSNLNSTWLFYNFLNNAQKKVYDAILENEAGLNSTKTASQSNTIVVSFSSREFIVDSSDIQASTDEAIIGAISAFMDDYPEYFWVGAYGYSYSYSYSGSTYWITKINLTLSLDTDDYSNWSVVQTKYSQLMNAVEGFHVTEGNRYTKCKSINDQLCGMIEYISTQMAHQPTGALLNGKSVCEGYAEAFKLICDRENIPCILVVGYGNGGAHEWNYVQMEDGKWYGVDVTWADQGEDGIYYDFFIVGSETLNAVFGGAKFGNGTDSTGDHINTGTHFNYDGFALTYPVISEQAYIGVVPFWNSAASFDNQKGLMFIPKGAAAKEQILCTFTNWAGNAPSTNRATVSGTTTGGTLRITSPISKTYKIVRWADVNADNNVNLTDYQLVKSYVSGSAGMQNTLDNDVAKANAADMNQDGVIDAFDMFYVNRYVNTGKFLNE